MTGRRSTWQRVACVSDVAVGLLWSGLFVGVRTGVVTPVLVPWEPTAFQLSERLVMVMSSGALVVLFAAATSGRGWAWLAFAALFAVNLPSAVELGRFLLAVALPLGAGHALQTVCQAVALLLYAVTRVLRPRT